MRVKIKRIDKEIPLPVYETGGSVGFDILARERTTVKSGDIALIPANIIVEVPKNHMLVVVSRSSTPKKKGLSTPHGFGIIDHDYCGPEDEIKIQVYNFSGEAVTINRGDKIAQGVFVRVDKFEWEEVAEMTAATRGGFGSTSRMKKNNVHDNQGDFENRCSARQQAISRRGVHGSYGETGNCADNAAMRDFQNP